MHLFVLRSGLFQARSNEQTQESQSGAEASLVDMTGDSLNEDQIMIQEDGPLLKVPPTKRKQKKIVKKR